MEHHAQAVEDHLIEGLSFKLRPGSSYITSRRNSTYYPAGSNHYSPNGTKVIRIPLTGDTWLDPTTVKLAFDLVNNAPAGADAAATTAKKLYPIGGGHVFFRRMRLFAGNALCEDIDDYHRLSQMLSVLQPKNKRLNDFVEGGNDVVEGIMNPIDGGDYRTIIFTPLSGLLGQDKYLPLRYCNIVIELELVNHELDAILKVGANDGVSVTTAATISQSWYMQNVRLLCDTVQLDNELDNQFAQHLLSGKTMPIQFTSYTTQKQSITTTQPTLNISRALTRLKDIFVTFDDEDGDRTIYKTANSFKHPSGTASGPNAVSFHLTIGSNVWPDYPAKSSVEMFYMLKKALGIQDSSFYDIDINYKTYLGEAEDTTNGKQRKFIIGQNLEKVINSNFTGLSTKAGDLITLKLDNIIETTHVYIHLHYDGILNITDIGSSVLD